MSAASDRTLAAGIVRLAARMLPRGIRDRYREQWLADVRDADEAGLSRASVAIGALAVVVTVDRPVRMPSREPMDLDRRSRLAAGLALSAALLALSSWSPFARSGVPDWWIGGSDLLGYAAFASALLGAIFAVVAPITALVLVSTRGARSMRASVRGAVVALVLASTVPVVRAALDGTTAPSGSVYATPGGVAFGVAGAAVVAAAVVLWRAIGPRRASDGASDASAADTASPRRRPTLGSAFRAVVAAVVVGSGASVGLIACAVAWAHRTPLVYGYPDTPEYDAMRAEWLSLQAQFEALVVDVLVVSAVLGLLAALATGLLARRLEARGAALTTVAALGGVAVGFAALADFLWLGTPSGAPPVATDAVLLVARWVLVMSVLAAVSGIRLDRRRRLEPITAG